MGRKPHWDPRESLHYFTWSPWTSPVSLAQVGETQQPRLGFEPEGSVVFVGFSSHSVQQHLFSGRKHQPVPLSCSSAVFAWQCCDWWVALSSARHNDSLLVPMLPWDREYSQRELRPCTPQGADRRNLSKKAALASFRQGDAEAGKQQVDSDRFSTQIEASVKRAALKVEAQGPSCPGPARSSAKHSSPRSLSSFSSGSLLKLEGLLLGKLWPEPVLRDPWPFGSVLSANASRRHTLPAWAGARWVSGWESFLWLKNCPSRDFWRVVWRLSQVLCFVFGRV